MQKRREITEKFIASLIVFIMILSNCATLGTALVAYAADSTSDNITYQANFVMLEDETEVNQATVEEAATEQPEVDSAQVVMSEVGSSESNENATDVVNETQTEESKEQTSSDENSVDENQISESNVTESDQVIEENTVETEVTEQPQEEPKEDTTNNEENVVENEKATTKGLAIELVLGVKNKGYLKNAKVEIKDLANQNFKIKDGAALGDYVQSINENKIKIKQINSGTEVKIYIPIELKNETSINVKKLQEGVDINLLGTYTDDDGNEEIITKSAKPVLDIDANVNLRVDSNIEKCIPYVKDGHNEALVQLKVVASSETKTVLPVKDTSIEMEIPQIDGAEIQDLSVAAISTGYTNGLSTGDVVFTVENWSYENGKVNINVNNTEKDGRYTISNGMDEYIISYKYVNCPDLSSVVLSTKIDAKSNVFYATGEKEVAIPSTLEKEYDLSHASSNIITYEVTGKSDAISKGYLYANSNSAEANYEVEIENAVNVNVSRVDMIKVIELREADEYFVDGDGRKYPTSTNGAENTYYKSVKFNKENLAAVVGEAGSVELLLEDGTSLVTLDKNTADDGDGFITISFGENKIGKIIVRVNNPEGEGILNILNKKVITKPTYSKIEVAKFQGVVSDYVGAAQLQEDIITELGNKSVATEFKDTITNATVSLSRNELSTLVENDDIEINIALNNATDVSDMYYNPVFELTLPEEVESINIKDMNLLYGNDELELGNVETLRDSQGRLVLKISLNGVQTKYTLGDSDKGTTIILKTSMVVNMYRASRKAELVMNYYNEDATNYGIGTQWQMISNKISDRNGNTSTALNIVAPEGFVNAQMISDYKDGESVISVNQGRKDATIATFADSRIAEMKMILINNTDEEMNDVHILGRTIFSGNKSIIDGEALGTNQDAPMVSEIAADSSNKYKSKVYYSENGDATDDLNDSKNGWTDSPETLRSIKSYLIVVDGTVKTGSLLMYSYNFEIPEQLSNNLDLAGTFGTYYTGTRTAGIGEPDKVVLTTGDAPVLKVETVSDVDEGTVTEGQHIKYTVKVTNEGRTVSEDTVVNSMIPQGTTYVDNGTLSPDTSELQITMGDIAPGETQEITYEVEVNTSVAGQVELRPDSNVEANGLENPIYTTTDEATTIEAAEVKVKLTSDLTANVLQKDREMEYNALIKNKTSEDLQNCEYVQTIPEGLEFVKAYVVEFDKEDPIVHEGAAGTYDAATRTVKFNIDSIENIKNFKIVVKGGDISEYEKEINSIGTFTASNINKAYDSNELKLTIARPEITMNSYSLTNNKYVKEGDAIEYVLDVTNVGIASAENINVVNAVPEGFTPVSAQCVKDDGTQINALIKQNVDLDFTLMAGQSARVTLRCIAENLSNVESEKLTANNWQVSGVNVNETATQNIENIIQRDETRKHSTLDEDNNTAEVVKENIPAQTVYINETNDVQTTPVENATSTYRIIGRAFNDFNKNGQRDDDEEGMANIVAKLCNAETQDVISQTVTNSVGEYVFDGVVPGEYYVKFEYDNTQYQLTDYKKEGVTSDRNSDAIISNYKAVTDKIKIIDTSISDIDIGLYKSGIFDLSLDANINKVTVQDDEETKAYEMENSKLAKIDINPKKANLSKVYVEYTISIANKGEIAGYAKRIVDYLPDGLTLDTSLNTNWYVGTDGKAYTTELEDVLINPGETKEIKLILTKQMTEESTGLINNTFEIADAYNEYAIADIDSTPGNEDQSEDDMSRADIIIGIQTGGSVINVMIISTTLITLLVALYIVKIQIDKRNKEVIV